MKNKPWILPGICFTLFLVFLLIGYIFTPYDPYLVNPAEKLSPPNSSHWFGTDHLGRDIFTRIVVGTPYTLVTPAIVLFFSMVIGVFIGLISGFFSKKVDFVITAVMDSFSSIPSLIIAIAITGLLGPGLMHTLLAILVSWWVQYARVVRNLSRVTLKQPFMLTAQLSGTFGFKLIYRHLFPNTFPLIREMIFLDMGKIILMVSSLSFLGLGAQPPIPEWGGMMLDGKSYFQIAPWVTLTPAIYITMVVMMFYLIGRMVKRDH